MNLNYLFNLIKAYKLGMYGADYAWILQETFEHNRWWESAAEQVDCSLKNLHTAVESVLIVSSYNNIVGEEQSISGLVCDKSKEKKIAQTRKPFLSYLPDKHSFRARTFIHEHNKTIFSLCTRNLRCRLEYCTCFERSWRALEKRVEA